MKRLSCLLVSVLLIFLLSAQLKASNQPAQIAGAGEGAEKLGVLVNFSIFTDDSFSFDPFTWSAGLMVDLPIGKNTFLGAELNMVFSEFDFDNAWFAPGVMLYQRFNSFYMGAGLTRWFGLKEELANITNFKIIAGIPVGFAIASIFLETPTDDFFGNFNVGINFAYAF